jgi:hypothetical protein
MVDSIVTRTLGVDFIYFDLIFLSIWIYYLIKKKYWIPIFWGILGWIAYLIADYYIWYLVMESRTYEGPINNHIFFLWFCFSAGFAQFSYVAIMFEKRNWKELWLWTLIFYLGWVLVGVGSQLIPLDDRIIRVSRNMDVNRQRLTFTLMTLGNIVIAAILYLFKKLRFEDIVYLFIVGTLVEFCLELSMSISGIRLEQGTWSLELMVVNTLIEFNMGIILMYLLWAIAKIKRDKKYLPPLSWNDFKYFKSDFNLITVLARDSNNIRAKNRSKFYDYDDIQADLLYFKSKYDV